MSERPTGRLFFELKLVDDFGRVHGIVRRELSDEAAFQGQRHADYVRMGLVMPGRGKSMMDAAVEVLRVREFRRKLFLEAARFTGGQLADFLEDREGWHGIDRQETTDRIAKEAR